MTDKPLAPNRGATLVFYGLAILGFYYTWGRTVIDGSLSQLLNALHGEKLYIFPGTNSALKTYITGIYWPLDYLLNVLVVFFWEAVDGSHPTTSVIGIYFLGQYISILMTLYIDSSRLGNAKTWKLAPLPWILAFQMMGAATIGPFYAIVYVTVSPFASKIPLSRQAQESLTLASSTWLLPISLAIGFIVPSVLMALPSTSLVSNGFQQMAIVSWNLFPILVYFVHTVLNATSTFLGVSAKTEMPSSAQHLSAVRFAYTCALIVSSGTHVAISSLSLTTVMFPVLFREEYARALSPRALLVPPTSWATVASLGEGVRSFLLWDQIFAYSTLLLLGYMQVSRSMGKIRSTGRPTWTAGLMAISILMIGPGSTFLALNWVRDESLFLNRTGTEHRKETSGTVKNKKFVALDS